MTDQKKRAARLAPETDGLSLYDALFGKPKPQVLRQRGKLDHASLPAPRRYLEQHGLLSPGQYRSRSQWVSICCPSHKAGGERNPSMRVSLDDGHFKCHACGATGGDIVALHRLVTGMGFLDAVADLGGRFHDA